MKVIYPSGQHRQKNGMKECVFVNSALYSAKLSKIHSYRLLFRTGIYKIT